MEDKNRKYKVEFSWIIPWLIGFLFTVGYVVIPEGLNFFEQCISILGYWFLWPIILGCACSGRCQ